MKSLILKLQKMRSEREKNSVDEVTAVSLCNYFRLGGAEVLRKKWDISWAEKQHFWIMSLISLLLHDRRKEEWWMGGRTGMGFPCEWRILHYRKL